jgi:hypothetical protein
VIQTLATQGPVRLHDDQGRAAVSPGAGEQDAKQGGHRELAVGSYQDETAQLTVESRWRDLCVKA